MLFYSLILTFYLLFIWLTFRNIRYGLYLILLFLPSYQLRYQIFGTPATLLEGMIWLLFIIWLIKFKKQKRLTFNLIKIIKNIFGLRFSIFGQENIIPRAFQLPIILFLTAATISVFTSPNLQAALGIWKAYFIEALLFFIIFVYNITTLEHVKHTIRTLGVLTIMIGLFAIYQKLTGALIPNLFWTEDATRRVTTFFGYPNANVLLLVPIVFLTIGNFLTDKKVIFKSFNLLVIILSISTIIWTKSAGALVAVITGVICFLTFYKKTRLATLLIIAVASLALLFSPLVINKIQNTFISINEVHLPYQPTDLQIRIQQWRETVAMLKDTPIFGAGLAGYQTLIAPYHVNKHIEIFLYPHNFFLNFLTETGPLGLIAIIWILAVFFYIGYRLLVIDNANQQTLDTGYMIRDTGYKKTLTLSVICAMIALLVHGLVDVPYFKNDLSILFWVIVGLMVTIINTKSETLNSKLGFRI